MDFKGRVAVFQAEYGLYSQTGNAILMLSQQGYRVDVFLYKVFTFWFDLKDNSGITFYKYDGSADYDETALIPDQIIRKSLDIIKNNSYRCLIGIERMGLIWAGIIKDQLPEVPLLYYSLELYTINYSVNPDPKFLASKAEEQKYLPAVSAVIIQDQERVEVLFRDNRITDSRPPVLFVPVSVWGPPTGTKGTYLRDTYNIPDSQKIILLFGQIWSDRFADHLVAAAQHFPAEWRLVLHSGGGGHTHEVFWDCLRKLDYNGRLVLSTANIPHDQIPTLISSAEIGVALYRREIENEFYTGSASEKMAFYLQSGLPVVVFNYPSFKRIIDQYHCGICIEWFNELKTAIERIFADYQRLSANAVRCFLNHYEFQSQFQKVIHFIDDLPEAPIKINAKDGINFGL